MKTGAAIPSATVTPWRLTEIPDLSATEFREQILQTCENNGRIVALFGQPTGAEGVRLFAVLANDAEGN